MMQESLFIVTSAIYTSHGKVNTENRIKQTKETLNSIKKYAPNSSIVLLDCGEKSIEHNMFDCKIIDYTSNKEIQLHLNEYLNNTEDISPDIIIKSMLEIMMCENYFKKINKNKYKRIFKLCGRYRLNSNFDYNKHLDAENKVLILPKKMSQHFYNTNIGITNTSMFQYMTRFWSFDSELLSEIKNSFYKMKVDIIKSSKSKTQCDIEHLLYKHLNKKKVENVKNIGIEGYWAPLNLWIQE